MKILLTTPLYPPEIADIAVYSKKLAEKLSIIHEVSLLTYANHPLKTDAFLLRYALKNQHVFKRIVDYIKILWSEVVRNDIIILQTGTSAAFPAFIISKIKSKKIIFRFFEDESIERKKNTTNKCKLQLIKIIQKVILKYSNIVICSSKNLQNNLIKNYKVKKDSIRLILDPQKREVELPFSRDEVSENLKKLQYVRDILNKGNEDGKISWDEHIEELKQIIQHMSY